MMDQSKSNGRIAEQAASLKYGGRLSTNRNLRDFRNRNVHLQPRAEMETSVKLPPSGTLVDWQHRRQALEVFFVVDAPNWLPERLIRFRALPKPSGSANASSCAGCETKLR